MKKKFEFPEIEMVKFETTIVLNNYDSWGGFWEEDDDRAPILPRG